jgi:hypothetical protein
MARLGRGVVRGVVDVASSAAKGAAKMAAEEAELKERVKKKKKKKKAIKKGKKAKPSHSIIADNTEKPQKPTKNESFGFSPDEWGFSK